MILRVADRGAKKSVKALKEGVSEIKIPHGGGLRVYFADLDKDTMLLLCGGNKRSQRKDILNAKKYWRLYGQQK